MSHPNIDKHKARPWLAGEVVEPAPEQDDDWWRDFQPWSMPAPAEQQTERREQKPS